MSFTIVKQDITTMKVDVIVNAANKELQRGGGVCGAIFEKAGAIELQKACNEIGPIETGEAVLTDGFHLPAKAIIHTAGPIYQDGAHGEEALLRANYRNSLHLAEENGFESIAFPLISSGIYGYPPREAFRVASDEIEQFLQTSEMHVFLVIFDKKSVTLAPFVMEDLDQLVRENGRTRRYDLKEYEKQLLSEQIHPTSFESQSLNELVAMADESFAQTLFRLIDERERTDVEVYKRANMDRKLFSKIRTLKGYVPKKTTVFALIIALELDVEEAEELLQQAGYAFSPIHKLDIIVRYFIQKEIYDIFTINEALYFYDQPTLG